MNLPWKVENFQNEKEGCFDSLLLNAYFILLLAINFYVYYLYYEKAEPLWTWYLGIIACSTLTCNFASSVREARRINIGFISLIFASVALYAYFTLQSYGGSNLWLDEATQLSRSSGNVLREASYEQHPPGPYILTAFLKATLGASKLSSKLSGFLPMLLSLIVFQFVFYQRKTYLLFGILLTSFYIIDVDSRYVSLEGRPVGYGILALSFTVLALKNYLKNSSLRNISCFGFCVYFYFNSLGMQPVFIMFVICFSMVVLSLTSKGKFRKYFPLMLVTLIALAAYIPIQSIISEGARGLNKFNPDMMGSLIDWINNLSLKDFAKYTYNTHMNPLGGWGLACLAIILLLKEKYEKKIVPYIGELLLFFTLYPIIFEIFFNIVISWSLNRWYFFSYFLLLNIFVFYILANYVNRKSLLLVLVLFQAYYIKTSDTERKYKLITSYRADWQKTYSLINNKVDKIYVLGTCYPRVGWCQNFFVGYEIFNNKNTFKARSFRDNELMENRGGLVDNGMVYDYKSEDKKAKIAIVASVHDFQKRDLLKLRSRLINIGYKYIRNGRHFVLYTTDAIDIRKEIPRFLEVYSRDLKVSGKNFFSHMLLAWINHEDKNFQKSEYWINRLQANKGLVREFESGASGKRMLNSLLELKQNENNY